MVEAVFLEGVVVEEMVVTKTAEVMGKLEPLHHNMVGAMDRQTIGPIVTLSVGRSEAEASDAVITGNLLVCDCMDSVLFDPGNPHFLMYIPHLLMV